LSGLRALAKLSFKKQFSVSANMLKFQLVSYETCFDGSLSRHLIVLAEHLIKNKLIERAGITANRKEHVKSSS